MSEKRKSIIIIVGAVILIGTLMIFSMFLLNKTEKVEVSEDGAGAYSDEQVEKPVIIIKNDYKLYHAIGAECSSEAFEQVRKVIRQNTENTGTITVKMNEESFGLYSSIPQVYSFEIETSEEQVYAVYVRVNLEKNEGEEERHQRTSTLIKKEGSDEYIFQTSATNSELINNLEKWRAGFN